jgi:hypothetical protein
VSANAAREVAANLAVIRDRAATVAPVAAAAAGGQAGEAMVKSLLTLRSHPAGTRTPSAPGDPPAKVSGDLARSVQRTPAASTGPGRASTTWGPTVIYGPVQEYGATIHVRARKVLADKAHGHFFGTQVTLPARPYVGPATRILIATGTFADVSSAAFAGALGF